MNDADTDATSLATSVANATGPTYAPWTTSRLLRRVLFEKPKPSYLASLGIFALYWGLPFLLAVIYGTIIPKDIVLNMAKGLATNLPDFFANAKALKAFANYQQLETPDSLAYLTDTTHFIFAVVISIGGGLAAHIIKRFNRTVEELRREEVPLATDSDVLNVYEAYRCVATHWAFRAASVVVAFLTFVIFVYLAKARGNTHWWGHLSHGYAGIVFALIEALMVYWGTRVLILIGMGSLMLVKLMQFPLALRPFHADACNGLSYLGYQIIYLWLFSLSLALAIYVVLSLGYLGIENTFIAWLLALCGTFAIPGLAVLPLLSALKSIHKARRTRLDGFEQILSDLLRDAEVFAVAKKTDEAVTTIGQLDKIYSAQKIINTANVWPFNPRALFSILLINIVQIIFTLDKLLGIFSQ